MKMKWIFHETEEYFKQNSSLKRFLFRIFLENIHTISLSTL